MSQGHQTITLSTDYWIIFFTVDEKGNEKQHTIRQKTTESFSAIYTKFRKLMDRKDIKDATLFRHKEILEEAHIPLPPQEAQKNGRLF